MARFLFTSRAPADALVARLNSVLGYPNATTSTYTEVTPARVGGGFLVKIRDDHLALLSGSELSRRDDSETTLARFRRDVTAT